MRNNIARILTLILVFNILIYVSINAQSGDNCANAVPLNTCDTTITNPGINLASASAVATDGGNAYWYVFTAPATGLINVNSCNGGIDTEVAIHDIGATGDCSLTNTIPSAESDDACPVSAGGSNFASEVAGFSVVAGNVYAIEWGDQWSSASFVWNVSYNGETCEPVTVTNTFANTIATQIDIVDTLSDGSPINASIEYGVAGFTPGTGTTITAISNPVIITGLSPGTAYDYCITNVCTIVDCTGATSNINSQTCGSITTDPTCTTPDITASTSCVTAGFFEISLEVTNSLAFGGGIFPGNASGFDIFVDNGSGYVDSGLDATSTAPVTIPGPFASGTPISVQLIGIDDSGCPSVPVTLDENCNPGSSCAFALQISGCNGIVTANGIDVNGTSVATDGADALWYLYTAPSNGILQISSEIDPNGTNTEVAVHDLGTTGDCATAANPATAEDEDSGVGSTSLLNLNVTAGNVYAIEWGNQWSADTFDWEFNLGCEAITGLTVVATTVDAVQIEFTDTLSDGTSITADIEYGPAGFTPGTGTVISGNSNPIIITGLNAGVTYDFCLTYACASGCASIAACSSFTTQNSCVVPIYTLTSTCIATGFFNIDVEVSNGSAFGGGLVPGNPSGFDIFIDPGTGFVDSGVDILTAGTAANVAGPFASGTAVSVQIFGIDDLGCPSAVQSINQDCACFGFAPANDLCVNATPLIVDTVATCDGITAPYTLACSSVDASDPVASCFNGGNNANVWFTFVAPANGNVTISTDYTGGLLTDTEIALYSGTCGSLTEIACDQDGGLTVGFNSIITTATLTGGDTYFVQVDRWGTSPDESFCLDVIDNDPVVNTCPQVLNITGLVATGTYSADDIITSNGTINASSGGPVNYEAGANAGGTEYIELTGGFEADGTVDFTAINIECDTTD